MSYLRIGVLAAAMVVVTILLGWWSVALVGVAGGLVSRPGRAAGVEAGAGAALAWATMLAGSAVTGPVWGVAERVGPVFGLPAPALVLVAVMFPALLAGSAALLAGGLKR